MGKVIITENQKMDIKNLIVFTYLNNNNYRIIESKNDIDFIKNLDDYVVDIRVKKNTGVCFIDNKLIKFINSFANFYEDVTPIIIGQWVGGVLQMNITQTKFPVGVQYISHLVY